MLAQVYDSYEIILIDDGSPDGSSSICDDYVRRVESRKWKVESIRAIHQENRGLSAARNAGLKAAKGEYVCFVDSDDYWEENVLGELMKQVEREQLDVLHFDYQNVRIADSVQCKVYGVNYEVFEPNKTPRYIDRNNEVVDGQTYLNTRMWYACYAVMFIVRRTILIDDRCIDNRSASIEDRRFKNEDCLFKEGIHFEDVDWLPRMMLRAKRVNSTTTIVYNYLVRQGSITKVQGDKKKIRKNIEDRLFVIDKYRQYIEQYPQCRWLKNMQSRMAEGVVTTIMREFYNERKGYIARLKDLKVFPLAIADQGKTYARRAKLINFAGPKLYCMLMHVLHR